MFNDLTGANAIVEESNKIAGELNTTRVESYKGMEVEIEKEMEVTKEDVDLPFYVYILLGLQVNKLYFVHNCLYPVVQLRRNIERPCDC